MLPKLFASYETLFNDDKIYEMSSTKEGVIWLKIKSILRKEYIVEFCHYFNLSLKSKINSDIFFEIFSIVLGNLDIEKNLDNFIKSQSITISQESINNLVSELYKMRVFNWGGDYKNALDRYLIDTYVKKHMSYDIISSKLDNEIHQALRGYVYCSWYNHWSTILIENIFKQHKKILPSVGNVKKVDFFIEGIPFDLKVTYLPNNYIDTIRKNRKLKSENAILKQVAKDNKISYVTTYEMIEKLRNIKDQRLLDIQSVKKDILEEAIRNPKLLINNLYEQQGEMRFDASNRLFLILCDTKNFDESWKLKRDVGLLQNAIFQYLENFNISNIINNPISFQYKNRSATYHCLSDVIFVCV
jgi:hypothetical protein